MGEPRPDGCAFAIRLQIGSRGAAEMSA